MLVNYFHEKISIPSEYNNSRNAFYEQEVRYLAYVYAILNCNLVAVTFHSFSLSTIYQTE